MSNENQKFPTRVTECFSMGGLRIDYFANDSAGFKATQETDRGREYLSLEEHLYHVGIVQNQLDKTQEAIRVALVQLRELKDMINNA